MEKNTLELLADLNTERKTKLAALEKEMADKLDELTDTLVPELEAKMKPALTFLMSLPDAVRQHFVAHYIAEQTADGTVIGLTFYQRGGKKKQTARKSVK